MEQLRREFKVTLEGEEIPLRFEVIDWMEAERKLKERLYPWGKTPFWLEQGGEMALRHILVFIFVGIQHARPSMTWEELTGLIDWKQYSELEDTIGNAVADFFLKLGILPSENQPTMPETTAEPGQTSGLTQDTTSDSATPSSST